MFSWNNTEILSSSLLWSPISHFWSLVLQAGVEGVAALGITKGWSEISPRNFDCLRVQLRGHHLGLTIQGFLLSKVLMSLVKLPTKCLSFRWEVKPFLQRRAIAIDVILLRVWQLLLYQVARWHNLLGIVITRRWAFKVTSNCYSLLVPIKGISRNEWLGGVTSFSDADCTVSRCCTRCSWLVR